MKRWPGANGGGIPAAAAAAAAAPRRTMARQPQLTFRQLAEYDDIAIDVVCDTLFGLEIYKVSPHYRSKHADRATVIRAIRDLARTQDLEAAYNAIVSRADWAQHLLSRKTLEQVQGFKEYAASLTHPLAMPTPANIRAPRRRCGHLTASGTSSATWPCSCPRLVLRSCGPRGTRPAGLRLKCARLGNGCPATSYGTARAMSPH